MISKKFVSFRHCLDDAQLMISMDMSYEYYSQIHYSIIHLLDVLKVVIDLPIGSFSTIHQDALTSEEQINGTCCSIHGRLHGDCP
jgi:hypothetical protein